MRLGDFLLIFYAVCDMINDRRGVIEIITFLGKSMTQFLKVKHIITEENAEIYEYGFEMIISTILGFLITLFIGILLQSVWLSLLYYVIFVLMRQLIDGYRANTDWKCNTVFFVVTFFTVGMEKIIYINQMYTFPLHVLLLIASTMVIWNDTPIENVNKPLPAPQKKWHHRIARILLCLLVIVSCVLYHFGVFQISILIALTLFIIAMLIVIEISRKESVPNKKVQKS